jgi:hypothetical protein
LFLGDSQTTAGGKVIAIAGNTGLTTVVFNPATNAIASSQWWGSADVRGMFFNGSNLYSIQLQVLAGSATTRVVVYTNVLFKPTSVTTDTIGHSLTGTIQALNTNGFSPILTSDGTNLWMIDQRTGGSTTIAIGSNGVSLPTGTINVASTTGFTYAGSITVQSSNGPQTIVYSSSNGTQFLGCTGGTGTLSTGGTVTQTATAALYKIPIANIKDNPVAGVSTFIYTGTDDPRCICFDGRYLWIGVGDGTNPPRLQILDPTAANPLTSTIADRTLKEGTVGTLTSSLSIDFVAFDGRRILCSLSGTTNTAQNALFSVIPEVFITDNAVTGGNLESTTSVVGVSTGLNAPKGIAVGFEGGVNSAVYVVDTLGIHKAYDPPSIHAGNAYLSGGQVVNVTTITTAYTILPADYIIRCNHTTGVTITLPASPRVGQQFLIKDVSASGASTFNITVARNGSTIDGAAANFTISTTGATIGFVCVGTNAWNSVFQGAATNLFLPSQAQGDITYYNGSIWTRLPAGTSGQVLRTQGSGADPQWANQIVLASEAQGDIIYRNASTWTRLPAGTSGQVLTTGGAGANPSWTTPSSGGTPTITTITANYTVLSTDYYIRCNHTSAITVTLPASPATAQYVNIKDVSSAGAGTNNILVVPSTGTIDGQSTLSISTNRASYGLLYVGSNTWDLV